MSEGLQVGFLGQTNKVTVGGPERAVGPALRDATGISRRGRFHGYRIIEEVDTPLSDHVRFAVDMDQIGQFPTIHREAALEGVFDLLGSAVRRARKLEVPPDSEVDLQALQRQGEKIRIFAFVREPRRPAELVETKAKRNMYNLALALGVIGPSREYHDEPNDPRIEASVSFMKGSLLRIAGLNGSPTAEAREKIEGENGEQPKWFFGTSHTYNFVHAFVLMGGIFGFGKAEHFLRPSPQSVKIRESIN